MPDLIAPWLASSLAKPRSRILHGHDWVYGSEILKAFGDPVDGGIVSIRDGRDRLLGTAMYNSRSQIVARRFSRQRQELDLDFFQRRISQAIEYRKRRGVDPRVCRLVWSESDGLPGLIIDRYGDAVVVQTLTLAMDQRLELIVEALKKELPEVVIVERNDAPVRRAEGMELRTGLLHGGSVEIQRVEILGLTFDIDVLHGQKTGFYLDQVESYRAVANWAKGRRVLDCFANQGAFALASARAGASEVTAVEISAEAVGQINANAARNAVAVKTVAANVFDFLKDRESDREAAGAQYDLIILDPPSFTKTKDKLQDAMRGGTRRSTCAPSSSSAPMGCWPPSPAPIMSAATSSAT